MCIVFSVVKLYKLTHCKSCVCYITVVVVMDVMDVGLTKVVGVSFGRWSVRGRGWG